MTPLLIRSAMSAASDCEIPSRSQKKKIVQYTRRPLLIDKTTQIMETSQAKTLPFGAGAVAM